jgi:hypothetical protein
VTATSCWVRDVRDYVNSASSSGGAVDACSGVSGGAVGTWEDITGCPAACDCRVGGQWRLPAGWTGAACTAAVEAQERSWWRAVRAYLVAAAAASAGDAISFDDGAVSSSDVAPFLLRADSPHDASESALTCTGAAADAALAGSGHIAGGDWQILLARTLNG